MIRRQLLQARAAARDDGRSRGQALQTVAVEWAYSGEFPIARMPPGMNVSDLGMHQSMDGCAADERAAADPGTHGDIDSRLDVLCGAPARAAAFTSVSNPMGHENSRRKAPTTSVPLQP